MDLHWPIWWNIPLGLFSSCTWWDNESDPALSVNDFKWNPKHTWRMTLLYCSIFIRNGRWQIHSSVIRNKIIIIIMINFSLLHTTIVHYSYTHTLVHIHTTYHKWTYILVTYSYNNPLPNTRCLFQTGKNK